MLVRLGYFWGKILEPSSKHNPFSHLEELLVTASAAVLSDPSLAGGWESSLLTAGGEGAGELCFDLIILIFIKFGVFFFSF